MIALVVKFLVVVLGPGFPLPLCQKLAMGGLIDKIAIALLNNPSSGSGGEHYNT